MTKKLEDSELDNIEILSEEINEIFGRVPPNIIRWGNTIILLFMFILLSVSFFFKYPEVLQANVIIHKKGADNYLATAHLPVMGSGKAFRGQKVFIQVDNFPHMEYGFIEGVLESISANPERKEDGLYYNASISFPNKPLSNYDKEFSHFETLYGKAEIITSNTSVFDKIIQPIKTFIKKSDINSQTSN